jgi:hypothetical protein
MQKARIPLHQPTDFSLVPPLTHCRSDGSGGRFDWTIISQHLDASVLHHAFILDPAYVENDNPEYVYLTSIWESLTPVYGQLKRDFSPRLLERGKYLAFRPCL